MRLTPELVHAAPFCTALRFDLTPIQSGFGGSPWHVAVASIALCRVRRNVNVIREMFFRWPTPETMETSDVWLEEVLYPLGLANRRARHIRGLSRRWRSGWSDLRDLPGVGRYVAAAVELCCFGVADDAGCDHVLEEYARARATARPA